MKHRSHILFVDDDKLIQYLVRHGLKNEFHLTICNDGLQAIKWLEESPQPDVIVTDLRMPLLGGKELIKQIRSSLKGKHIPIIVLSATDDISMRIQCLSLGADDFVIKPFTLNELSVRIKAQIIPSGQSVRE
jgi:DNA-binding response OmpR family regulator